jgi:HD-like signal output (HDOD) protein
MEAADKFVKKEDQLAYVIAVLKSLGDMVVATGSPLLVYFLDLAAAQARDEYREVMNQPSGLLRCPR